MLRGRADGNSLSPRRVVVAAVRASDIVNWDGIDTRALFELNVRREVRRNRVRDQLEAQSADTTRQGLPCVSQRNDRGVQSLELKPDRILAKKPSVVNGAQSTIAFARAAADDEFTQNCELS